MAHISNDDVARLYDEVLIPKMDDVIRKHLHPLRKTLDLLARGLAELHFRMDELRNGAHDEHDVG